MFADKRMHINPDDPAYGTVQMSFGGAKVVLVDVPADDVPIDVICVLLAVALALMVGAVVVEFFFLESSDSVTPIASTPLILTSMPTFSHFC